jgi:large subunit ribosomal protein L21
MTVIFEDRGRQYTVKKDDVIYIDKIDLKEQDKIEFDKILFLKDNENVKIGTPYVEKGIVKATVVKNVRDEKIIVFKFKRKKNYKRTRGHKQPYTMIKIDEITA